MGEGSCPSLHIKPATQTDSHGCPGRWSVLLRQEVKTTSDLLLTTRSSGHAGSPFLCGNSLQALCSVFSDGNSSAWPQTTRLLTPFCTCWPPGLPALPMLPWKPARKMGLGKAAGGTQQRATLSLGAA